MKMGTRNWHLTKWIGLVRPHATQAKDGKRKLYSLQNDLHFFGSTRSLSHHDQKCVAQPKPRSPDQNVDILKLETQVVLFLRPQIEEQVCLKGSVDGGRPCNLSPIFKKTRQNHNCKKTGYCRKCVNNANRCESLYRSVLYFAGRLSYLHY